MVSVSSVWRGALLWAAASNERAISNARAAATECSRLRVERAEVEQFLAAYAAPQESRTGHEAGAVATGR